MAKGVWCLAKLARKYGLKRVDWLLVALLMPYISSCGPSSSQSCSHCSDPIGRSSKARQADHPSSDLSERSIDGGTPVEVDKNNQLVGWLFSDSAVRFSFDSDFPKPFRSGCENAAKTINQALGWPLVQFTKEDYLFRAPPKDTSEVANLYNAGGPFRNIISFGKGGSGLHSGSGELARASVNYIEINGRYYTFKADIDFDVSRFPYSVSGEVGKADVESVCLHEMEHTLNLAHSTDAKSSMYYQIVIGIPDATKRELSPADVQSLRLLYPPSGSFGLSLSAF